MKKIILKIECQSCGGTGVYVGIGERGGAGVICHTCKGTGCQDYSFEYEPFVGRKSKNNVKRVYADGYGYCIAPEKLTLANGVNVDFSKEGVSYAEFLEGEMPEHIKKIACPMLVDRPACYKIKGFVDECNKINDGRFWHMSSCKCKNKLECWDRFEAANKRKDK